MPSEIARNLRQHMDRQGLGPRDIARRCDIKPSFIYDILNGKSTNPSTVKLAQVAHALGVPLAQLIESNRMNMPTTALRVVASEAFDGWYSPPLLTVFNKAVVEREQHELSFSKGWLKEEIGISSAPIALLKLAADNMSPTLLPGDWLLLDRSQSVPTTPGIFVTFDGAALTARRLEPVPSNGPRIIRLSSDNLFYQSFELPLTEVHLIGRVAWFSRHML